MSQHITITSIYGDIIEKVIQQMNREVAVKHDEAARTIRNKRRDSLYKGSTSCGLVVFGQSVFEKGQSAKENEQREC